MSSRAIEKRAGRSREVAVVPGSHSLDVRGAPVSVTREGAIGTSATGSSMARSEASMAAQSSTATGTAVTNDGTASSSMVIVMAAPGCTGPSKPSTTVSLSAVCVTDSSVDPASTSPRTMAPSLVPVPDPGDPLAEDHGHHAVLRVGGDRLDRRRGAGRAHPQPKESNRHEGRCDQRDATSQPHCEFPAWPFLAAATVG